MNKSMAKAINFSIALFLINPSLMGMDTKQILFKQEHTIEHPYDLARIEVSIVGAGTAPVVNDAKPLAQVMKEIGSGADQAVHLSFPQKIGDELSEARRNHCARQAEEDGYILIEHSLPDAQGCSELAALKTHLAHVRYEIGHTPILHGYGSPYPLSVADKIMTVTVIHFIPLT